MFRAQYISPLTRRVLSIIVGSKKIALSRNDRSEKNINNSLCEWIDEIYLNDELTDKKKITALNTIIDHVRASKCFLDISLIELLVVATTLITPSNNLAFLLKELNKSNTTKIVLHKILLRVEERKNSIELLKTICEKVCELDLVTLYDSAELIEIINHIIRVAKIIKNLDYATIAFCQAERAENISKEDIFKSLYPIMIEVAEICGDSDYAARLSRRLDEYIASKYSSYGAH